MGASLDRLKQSWELHHIRQLPNGMIIGIARMMFTWSLMVDISEWLYERRYCYKHYDDAVKDFTDWNGVGAPPGPWIKEKPSDINGPGAE